MKRSIATCLSLLVLSTTPVLAQETSQPQSRHCQQPSVRQIVARLSEQTGRKVLVTTNLAGQLTTALEGPVTESDLEKKLTDLAKRLPDTIWTKVYLPAPSEQRPYTGDAVAQFALAQTELLGLQNKADSSTIPLLGKQMSVEEAQPYIKGLGLEPYYVLMNRTGATTASGQRVAQNQSAISSPTLPKGAGTVLDTIMKKLGITNPLDIPAGNYDVVVVDENGNQVPAHIEVNRPDDYHE